MVARLLNLGFSVFRWGWESQDLVWKTPLGYLMVFAPLAAVLALLGTVAFRRSGLQVALAAWCILILWTVLLLFPEIHGYASLVLAAGIGLPLSGVLHRHATGTLRVARLISVAGVVLVGGLALLLPRLRAAGEARTIAALPVAPDGAPNVLLLILDTVRADYMSLYGATEPTTPHLDQWARSSVLFTESYSTSSWTVPTHASLFTGQYPSVHGASFTRSLDEGHRTLAEVLSERGWATGGFTANLVATRAGSGLAQGFIRYEDLKSSPEEILKSTTITQASNVLEAWQALAAGHGVGAAIRRMIRSGFEPRFSELTHDDKPAEEVRADFLRWLDGVGSGRPFFAFLNFFDAHAPFLPPEPYRSMFPAVPEVAGRYRGGIRYIDGQVDLLLREMERRGLLDQTIVIVTSDHGEKFGEHDERGHSNSLYRQLLHVPLLVRFPAALPQGVAISRQVTLRDLPATILDLLGVPQEGAIGGSSLAPLWQDTMARGSEVIAELDQDMREGVRYRSSYGPMKALLDDSLHVIRDGRGHFEAYLYRDDPGEERNLLQSAADSLPYARMLQEAVVRHRLAWPQAVPREAGVGVVNDELPPQPSGREPAGVER